MLLLLKIKSSLVVGGFRKEDGFIDKVVFYIEIILDHLNLNSETTPGFILVKNENYLFHTALTEVDFMKLFDLDGEKLILVYGGRSLPSSSMSKG